MTTAMMIFGILTVCTSLGVISAKSPVKSGLWLIATLLLIAVHFAMLDAHFVAAIQVLVYAGAIMVLVMFVIMLLGVDVQLRTNPGKVIGLLAAIGGGIFVGMMFFVIRPEFIFSTGDVGDLPAEFGTVESVGEILFSRFIYPFEIVSLLLLAAMIGAVLLASDKARALPLGRGLRAKASSVKQEVETKGDSL